MEALFKNPQTSLPPHLKHPIDEFRFQTRKPRGHLVQSGLSLRPASNGGAAATIVGKKFQTSKTPFNPRNPFRATSTTMETKQ